MVEKHKKMAKTVVKNRLHRLLQLTDSQDEVLEIAPQLYPVDLLAVEVPFSMSAKVITRCLPSGIHREDSGGPMIPSSLNTSLPTIAIAIRNLAASILPSSNRATTTYAKRAL